MKLTFLGGAGTVTGSKYLLESGRSRVLIDCGLFQGPKELRARNWQGSPVDPATLDAIVLTHAHIDHSGFLPVLFKEGYRGPVFCSRATADLLGLLLPDCGHIQEEDARFANKHGFSSHRPARPLYTRHDAEEALGLLEPVGFDEPVELAGRVGFTFRRAGHILGAASVLLRAEDSSVLFTGDLGRPDDLLMRPPDEPPDADHIVCESTYGDRVHESGDAQDALGRILRTTAIRGGTTVVPCFAVGRAQVVLHLIARLKEERRVPDIPVFLDSPMAIDTTAIHCRHRAEHRLEEAECRAMCGAARYLRTPDESKSLNDRTDPIVILSASGMATGGRVLHHLKRLAPDSRNSILFVGFQAAGTRGAAITGGASAVRIHGMDVPIRADVARIDGLSAHADRDQIVSWLVGSEHVRRVFIVHGESRPAQSLAGLLAEKHLGRVTIPRRDTVEDLT